MRIIGYLIGGLIVVIIGNILTFIILEWQGRKQLAKVLED